MHRLFIETEEPQERVFVYVYSPYNVPPRRMDVMSRILNRVNAQLILGRLACDDDEDASPVQFKCGFDVEGSTLSPIQVSTLIKMGTATFEGFGSVLVAAALTRRSADELWSEFLAAQEAAAKAAGEKDDEGPSEL